MILKKFYILTILLISGFSFSQSFPVDWYRPNGKMNAMASDEANNLMYFGGEFSGYYPSYLESYGTLVDPVTGIADTSFVNPNNFVRASISDGNGGLFIAGDFTQVGDSIRSGIAHLNALGEVTSWRIYINDPILYINTLEIYNNTLYVGGIFNQVQGGARTNLAAFDVITGALLPWNPTSTGLVNFLVEENGFIYCSNGGSFTDPNGTTAPYLVRINPIDGSIDNWFPNVTHMVKSIVFNGNDIYIGGTFQTVGGQIRNRLACISAIDASLQSWDPNATGMVNVLKLEGNELFVGGAFNSINGQTRKSLASFDITTGQLTSLSRGFDAQITAIHKNGQELFVGGEFSIPEFQAHRYIAKIDLNTGEFVDWDPGVNNSINTFENFGGALFIGGYNSYVGVQNRFSIAAVDLNTGKPNALNSLVLGTVNDIILKDTLLYFVGEFGNVGDQLRNNFACINLLNDSITDFTADTDGPIYNLLLVNDTLYVGGNFTTIKGQSRMNLAAIDLNTGSVLPWNPSPNGPIFVIENTGNFISVGGAFTTIDTTSRNNIARFTIDSLHIDFWAPNFDNTIRTICEIGNDILVGGDFNNVNNSTRNYIASVSSSTGFLNPLDVNPDQRINKIELINGKVYLAGAFTIIGGQNREQIAQLEIDSAIITSWQPQSQFDLEAIDIATVGGYTYVSGDINFYGIDQNGLIKSSNPGFTSVLPLSVSNYSFPSLLSQCSGSVFLNATGISPFSFNIDQGNSLATSNGFMQFNSLCAGIHTLKVYDYYGDSIEMTIVIPSSNTIIQPNNQSLNSINDLLGTTNENCNVDFSTIDTILIYTTFYSNDTLTAIWEITDTNGPHYDTVIYYLNDNNANGLYNLQYSIYCSAIGNYFTVTQSYYFQHFASLSEPEKQFNGEISIYPNPTSEFIRINISEEEYTQLIIFDAQGKIIKESKVFDNEEINLTNLDNGVYFLDFTLKNSKVIKRLIKN